jgi:hypothetical protein
MDAVCTSRDNCFDPMEAGIVIRQGSPTSDARRTMAFHIAEQGDREYLSAGHCGHRGSNYWYHQGYGQLGIKVASQLVSPGRDIARFEFPDAQISHNIYQLADDVEGSGNPVQDEVVCASWGRTGAFDCGTVADALTTWTSTTCDCEVEGANAAGIFIHGGESGSPIMRRPNPDWYIGVGIVNQTNGNFARLQDGINHWGFQVYITD